jgi:hypothetical protein
MRPHRRAFLAAGIAVALGIGGPALGTSPTAAPAVTADATMHPLVSGTSAYDDGTYVWTDYAYDDRGADTNGTAGGDTTYPSDIPRGNVADLIQLQLHPQADGLVATAVLETLSGTSRPLVGIGLDLDGPKHGAASLPGSWTAATPLGMDRLYVLSRDGGQEMVADSSGHWRKTRRFSVTVDGARNTVSGVLPIQLPSSGSVRAVTAVGYQDGGKSWVNGTAPVMDLGFVNDGWLSRPYLVGVALDASGFATGDSAYWQDRRQASILAGKASPAPAVATIDLGALHARSIRAPALHPGFDTFLYHSSLRLGEGVVGSGNTATYAGPYQPYLVHLPKRLRVGLPLLVYMHGSSQTYTSPVNTSQYDPGTRMAPLPLPEDIVDFDAVVAWPLGRGPQQNYSGASEQDVLDVTDDVTARLGLDRERTMLSGLSLGGIGAFRLGELYPDRWSLVYADVGYDQTGLTTNLTDLPLRFQNAVADPLVNVAFTLQTRQGLTAAGTVDYLSALQLRTTHQPAVKLAECIYRDGLSRARNRAPARVRYTVDSAMFRNDPQTGLRLSYDGAYWVSGMRTAPGAKGSVDLVTRALGKRLVVGPDTSTMRDDISSGRDFCGPNPDNQGLDVWSEQARRAVEVKAPAAGLLTGTLNGLSAVTVDAATAGLAGFGVSTLRLTTDRAVSLTLAGLPSGSRMSVGTATGTAGTDGRATVQLAAGGSVVQVTRS